MSYAIYLYHPQVKATASQGLELDEFDHPVLSESDVQLFLKELPRFGYVLENQSAVCKEFVKQVGTCPVQVGVFKTEIAFSVPYWSGSADAIFEALQDSAELCDTAHLVTFNPQNGEWGP